MSQVQEHQRNAAVPPEVLDVSLITNGISWYLRSTVRLDKARLAVTTPRTVLGLIPMGTDSFDVAFAELRRISIGSRLHPDRLLVAVALALLGAFGSFGAPATAGLVVGAVAMALLSFIAVIRIEEVGLKDRTIPICLAHIPRARRLLAEVEGRAAARSRPGG